MVRSQAGTTNVTVRKGLVDLIEEEIVRPGYLGYTSNAEVVHDGGRLMVFLVVALKLARNEAVQSDRLFQLVTALAKKGGGVM